MDNIEEKYFFTRGKVILFALILIILLIVVIVIKNGNGSSEKEYTAFENELKVAAENYFIILNYNLKDGESKRVQVSEVLKLYSTDNVLKDKCIGYIVASSEKDISTGKYKVYYRPYIKCGNSYMTSNYSEY